MFAWFFYAHVGDLFLGFTKNVFAHWSLIHSWAHRVSRLPLVDPVLEGVDHEATK